LIISNGDDPSVPEGTLWCYTCSVALAMDKAKVLAHMSKVCAEVQTKSFDVVGGGSLILQIYRDEKTRVLRPKFFGGESA